MARIAWTVPGDWQLEWRQWGQLFVVFNPVSDDTHLLNAASARLLRSLETKPSTREELEVLLAEFGDRPSDDAVSKEVEALLRELDELGLIVPVES